MHSAQHFFARVHVSTSVCVRVEYKRIPGMGTTGSEALADRNDTGT